MASAAAASAATRAATSASAAAASAAQIRNNAAQRQVINTAAAKALKEDIRKVGSSSLKDESKYLPQFLLEEIEFGRMLGKGFFGAVYEIRGFSIQKEEDENKRTGGGGGGAAAAADGNIYKSFTKKSRRKRNGLLQLAKKTLTGGKGDNNLDSDDDDSGQIQFEEYTVEMNDDDDGTMPKSSMRRKITNKSGRYFIAQHCLRGSNGQARYAIKILQNQVIADPRQYYQGIMDINSETRLLSAVQHPNIIKLRALAKHSSFEERFHERYFIVLDRLYDVLEVRIHKKWKSKYQRTGGTSAWGQRLLDSRGLKRAKLLEKRLLAAYDLSSALDYLHSRRIIHRDLKPDNIGFDIRDDIKIFDFGLARELPPRNDSTNPDDTFKMTDQTGTPRYMAPEVALGKPYNVSCDTYSFCILLWEMLALKPPFELYTMKSFKERVWAGIHKRPPIDDSWPDQVKYVLDRGWCASPLERLSMSTISEMLETQITVCREGGGDGSGGRRGRGLERMSRRSTYIFEPARSGSSRTLQSAPPSPYSKDKSYYEPSSSATTPSSSKKDRIMIRGSLDETQETQRSYSPSSTANTSSRRLGLETSSSQSNLANGDEMTMTPTSLPSVPVLFEDDDAEHEHENENENDHDHHDHDHFVPESTKTNHNNVIQQEQQQQEQHDDNSAQQEMKTSSSQEHYYAPATFGQTNYDESGRYTATSRTTKTDISTHSSGLWERIENERIRQDSIRAHLATIKATM